MILEWESMLETVKNRSDAVESGNDNMSHNFEKLSQNAEEKQ